MTEKGRERMVKGGKGKEGKKGREGKEKGGRVECKKDMPRKERGKKSDEIKGRR